MKNDMTARKITALVRSAALCAVALGFGVFPVSAANLTRSIEVNGAPSAVWSMIGSFCAIKDWLPPVGMCIEDGKSPPTRTLVTKDGRASFVEMQTARNEKEYTIPTPSYRARCPSRTTNRRSRSRQGATGFLS